MAPRQKTHLQRPCCSFALLLSARLLSRTEPSSACWMVSNSSTECASSPRGPCREHTPVVVGKVSSVYEPACEERAGGGSNRRGEGGTRLDANVLAVDLH